MQDDNLNPSGDPQKESESGKDPEKGGKDGDDPTQYVTPERLQGVLQHQKRSAQKELQSTLDKFKNTLTEELAGQISEALKKKEEGDPSSQPSKGGKKDQTDPELVALRRRSEEQEKSISTLQEELASEKTRAKQKDIKARVMEALRKNDCEAPEVVYSHIQGMLEQDDENGNIIANVPNAQYGTVDPVSLDEFIKKEVRENMIPQLFKGANRGGGPAEGDKGSSGRRAKYDWNAVKGQIDILNSEEFQKAMDNGEVANLPGGR